jgi:hypothetical protein
MFPACFRMRTGRVAGRPPLRRASPARGAGRVSRFDVRRKRAESAADLPPFPREQLAQPLAVVALDLDGRFAGAASGAARFLELPRERVPEAAVRGKPSDDRHHASRSALLDRKFRRDFRRDRRLRICEVGRTVTIRYRPSALAADASPVARVDEPLFSAGHGAASGREQNGAGKRFSRSLNLLRI